MVSDQTIQRLNWLDEEHRRDKATLLDLNSKIDTYLSLLNGFSKGLQDLEERLARVQGQSLRYSQIESALAQLKTEVNMMFEQSERRGQQREGEYLQVRTLDRDRDQTLPNRAGPDSVNLLPALLGESQVGRDVLVEQARSIALRKGAWKLIEPSAGPTVDANTKSETGAATQAQLYNLADDLAESKNLAKQHPEKFEELSKMLDDIRRSGRMP